MTSIGHIIELWRYPVSSVGGEKVDSLELCDDGVNGDRAFTLFDPETQETASPESNERWRKALHLLARQTAGGVPDIGFPDGTWLSADATDLTDRLSHHFGFPVALGARPDRQDGRWPVRSPRYVPSPVHLLTTASLNELRAKNEALSPDPRRFRPNILVETTVGGGFVENAWIGRKITVGDVSMTVTEGTKRCGMTMVSQPGLAEEPEILRNILRHNRRNLGVYGTIDVTGNISVGDRVLLTD